MIAVGGPLGSSRPCPEFYPVDCNCLSILRSNVQHSNRHPTIGGFMNREEARGGLGQGQGCQVPRGLDSRSAG